MAASVRLWLGAARSVRATARFLLHSARYRSLYKYLRRFPHAQPGSGPKVVILSGHRQEHGIVFLEAFLAAAIVRLRGQVRLLIDDTVSDYWDGMIAGSSKEAFDLRFRPWVIQKLLGARQSALAITYSALLGRRTIDDLERRAIEMARSGRFEYEGIDLWPHVESSLVRYFRSTPLLMREYPEYPRALEGFTRNALVSAAAASRVIETWNPEHAVSAHAVYGAWGPFMEIMRRRGVGAITYGLTGMVRNTVSFSRAALPSLSLDDGYFGANQHRIPIEAARAFTSELMEGRASGARRLTAGTPRTASSSTVLDELDRRFGGRQVFAMFPNVLWEFECIPQIAGVFRTREEWLIRTVEHFIQHPDEPLVIRAHPWESSKAMATVDGVERVLERHLGRGVFDRENILLIRASDPTSSYRLFPRMKAGIVHTGTLGLELVYAGIPAIVAGHPGYATHPFVRRYETPEDYFRAFGQLESILAQQEDYRDLFMQYVYYYFQVAYLPLQQFDTLFHSSADGRPPTPDSLASDPDLLGIADTILRRREFGDLRLA